MSILVTPETRVLIQGITGSFGSRHARLSLDYGTQIVAGVTPGKGGQTFEQVVPIFDTVSQAVKETGATVSAIFVPPPFAAAVAHLRANAVPFVMEPMESPVCHMAIVSDPDGNSLMIHQRKANGCC